METLIMHPKNKEQLTALKAIAKAFKIDFQAEELTERERTINLYGKEAVETIERGEEDIKAGRVTRIKDVKNIWESIL
jgi:hypothetical protein